MKKLMMLVIFAGISSYVHADNTNNGRFDSINWADGTVQVSSPAVGDFSTRVPYSGATTDVDISTHNLNVGTLCIQGDTYSALSSSGLYVYYYDDFLGGGHAATIAPIGDSFVGGSYVLPLFIDGAPLYINYLEGLTGQETTTYMASSFTDFWGEVRLTTITVVEFGSPIYIATNTYTLGYSSAAAFYGDGSNLTGISDTKNVILANVIIATYSTTGVDYVCDGTDDQEQFNLAFNAVGEKEVIFVKPGTYYFTKPATMSVMGTYIQTLTAEIRCAAGILQKDTSVFYVNIGSCTVDGFTFNGIEASNSGDIVAMGALGDYATIKNNSFINWTKTSTGGNNDSRMVMTNSNSTYGVISGNMFYNNAINTTWQNDSTSGWIFKDNKIMLSQGGWFNQGGTDCQFINNYLYGVKGTNIVLAGGNRSLVSGNAFVIVSGRATSGKIMEIRDANTTVSNNMFSNGDVHGIAVYSSAYDVTITGNVFDAMGGTGDDADAINAVTGADDVSITNNNFTGVIDRYAIGFHADCDRWIVSNNNFQRVTGQVANMNVLGTGHIIGSNQPTTEISRLRNPTTHYASLTINDTFYYNASYAHGYATDVDVSVTGSTDTFTILNPTWVSPVTPNGFTISGASCTYSGIGGTPKIFKVSGAFSAISDTVNTTAYWAIFKNGELYKASIVNRKIAVAADVGAMAISALVSLVTGDILDVRLSGNETAVITNNFVQFDIIQIN